jgi:hypothetical protein
MERFYAGTAIALGVERLGFGSYLHERHSCLFFADSIQRKRLPGTTQLCSADKAAGRECYGVQGVVT